LRISISPPVAQSFQGFRPGGTAELIDHLELPRGAHYDHFLVIRTVLGDISPGDLGTCDAHEHLFLDTPVQPGEGFLDVDLAIEEAQTVGIASGTFRTGPIGTLTLNNSSVTDNVSGNGGGGILNHAGTLTINNSEVNDNTAQGGGGGIASGRGGETGNSVLKLNNSQVNGNTSNGGVFAGAGGIANGGSMTISNTQVNGNMAPDAPGGGILNHGLAVINNTDVNGNMALGDTGGGGGIANADDGAPDSGMLDLNNVRVMHNEADGGGGGILNGLAISGVPAGVITTNNIKVILNSPDNCEPLGTIAGCTG
jgi:hypothetical protein